MAVATTNGLNGHTNSPPKSSKSVNGHASGSVTKRSSTGRRGPSFLGRLFSIVARLFTWYSIITVLFRCPPTLEACDDKAPKICKPYFQVKQAVSPHLTPYYDAYAAPYIDMAKPYYDTVDRIVITPSRTYAVKYAGPRVAQAQALGKAQWERSVQPQLVKYHGLAKEKYDQTLAPHVNKASEVVTPYYDVARTNALQTYHEMIFPAYTAVAPYAIQGYNAAHDFTVTTAIPSGLWAWKKTNAFLDSTVWPHLHDIYAVKVEPQLVRIGERLGRYSEKKPKVPNNDDNAESHATKSTASASSSSFSATSSDTTDAVESHATAPTTAPAAAATSSQEPEATPVEAARTDDDANTEKGETAREIAARTVQEDLELWEGKFSKVAEEGAAEIEDRIEEISSEMLKEDITHIGRPLLVELYNTVLGELPEIRKEIAESMKRNVDDREKLDEDVQAAIRRVGLKVKEAAQACREWRKQFDEELEKKVTTTVQEHFEILERTRDLAMQKIGMKWAWMDGVTYKDWQKYHELKDKFREWINDLKRLIVTHPALLETQEQAAHVDDQAVGVAENAVKKLMEIKQVVNWKVVAGDFTENFDPEKMKKAAREAEKSRARAEEAAIKKAAEDEAAAQREAAEAAATAATEEVEHAAQSFGDQPQVVLGQADESSQTAGEQVGEHVIDTDTSALPPLESLTEEPTHSATDLASDATNQAEFYEPLPVDEAVVQDGPEQVAEEIVEESEQPLPPPAATPEVKSAWLGAAAQAVPSRQPIIDDEYLESAKSVVSVVQKDVPASITSAAQAAYTAAIAQAANKYSRAMSVVSVQLSGEPKPMREQMYSSVSDAYFAAMASANAGLNSALTAASGGVYGTPTNRWIPAMPTVPSVDWERVQSIAQENLDETLGWASEQYEAAKKAAADQVEAAKVAVGADEPSPSNYLEAAEIRAQKLREQAQHNYYAGLGVAYARYSEFLSAASTAVSSLTATPTPTDIQGSASSVASVVSETAASVASEAVEMAANAGESVGETWEFLVSAVSSQIYGAPKPTAWYENFYDAAGDYATAAGGYAAVATDAAGDQLAQVTDAVNMYAVSASSIAEVQYSAISSLVSELIIGKEPTFTESVYSRLSGAYDFGIASASSMASVASETIASVASEVTEGASSVISAIEETVASATEVVKETVQSIVKDEL